MSDRWRDIEQNVKIQQIHFMILRRWTFCLLSTDRVIIKGLFIAHWEGLIELNQKAVRSYFYERKMMRYHAKRKMAQYRKVNFAECLPFCSISHHRSLIEVRSHRHSIQLGETFLMSYK